jgi:hypothetical protein
VPSGQLLLGTLIVILMVFFHVSALMGLAGFIDRVRHSPMFSSRRLGNSYIADIHGRGCPAQRNTNLGLYSVIYRQRYGEVTAGNARRVTTARLF